MIRKLRYLFKYLFCLLLIFSTGCGTFSRCFEGHVTARPDPRYYSTKVDLKLLTTEPNDWVNLRPFAPIFIIDMPFAVVLDTICLPVDQYYYMNHREIEIYWMDVLDGKGGSDGKRSAYYFDGYAFCFIISKIEKNEIGGESLDKLYGALLKIESSDFVIVNRKGNLIGIIAENKILLEKTYEKIFSYAKSNNHIGILKCIARNPSMPEEYYSKLYDINNIGIMYSLACQNPSTPEKIKNNIEKYAIEVKKNKYAPEKNYYDNFDYYTAKEILEYFESIRKVQQKVNSQ